MNFASVFNKKNICPCENCGAPIKTGRENLCAECMKVFYNEPLNKPVLRKCRKCAKLSHNYFYCHDHAIKHGDDNDFLDYNLGVKRGDPNKRYG